MLRTLCAAEQGLEHEDKWPVTNMTPKIPVTTMIFTLNEEIHLPSCLASLKWCDDVIAVDSFSSDRTGEICHANGIRFFQHAFEGFGKQRNWALENTSPKSTNGY